MKWTEVFANYPEAKAQTLGGSNLGIIHSSPPQPLNPYTWVFLQARKHASALWKHIRMHMHTHSSHVLGFCVLGILGKIQRIATLLSPNKIFQASKWGATQDSCVISLDGVSSCFKVIYITTAMIHGGGEQKWGRKRAYWLYWVSQELCPQVYCEAANRRSALCR